MNYGKKKHSIRIIRDDLTRSQRSCQQHECVQSARQANGALTTYTSSPSRPPLSHESPRCNRNFKTFCCEPSTATVIIRNHLKSSQASTICFGNYDDENIALRNEKMFSCRKKVFPVLRVCCVERCRKKRVADKCGTRMCYGELWQGVLLTYVSRVLCVGRCGKTWLISLFPSVIDQRRTATNFDPFEFLTLTDLGPNFDWILPIIFQSFAKQCYFCWDKGIPRLFAVS